ncbi:MAG: hypothetical protein A3K68_01545 [Euryarchaeota archaeon RBG_16_68_13]|nr:MAG: hypothetical protein A3K68_01545 [Euryarchaeota archaeon RBG_16_68_13]
MPKILAIRDLQVWFPVRTGLLKSLVSGERRWVRAVDGISFDVERGDVFCLVGESGCGKTTTGKAILRLNEATGGGILFDLPQTEWGRVSHIRRRLLELEPAAARLKPEDWDRGTAAFSTLRDLKGQVETSRGGESLGASSRRIEHLESLAKLLEDRAGALRSGEDPMIARVLAKRQNRLRILQEYGSAFTPRRVRKLERLERELKEAEYRLRMAEHAHIKEGKWRRKTRSAQSRLERIRETIRSSDPDAQRTIQELSREIEERQKKVIDRELADVEADFARLRAESQSLRRVADAGSEPRREEFRRLEKAIADVREGGGPALPIIELRSEWSDIRSKYDLVAWAEKRGRPSRRERRRRNQGLRKRAQIIYQDPYESLNPKLSIFDIVAEPLLANKIVATPSEAEAVVRKALEDVGLTPADEFMFRFPHELSGGQRQRVGVATALVVDPDFIVADEPVSMLDASVRTEILALLLDLKKRRNLTYLFITHDLSLAWIIADKIAVMYLGKIVEMGEGPEVIQNPRHPYTKALISVVPSPNPEARREKIILRGERPNPADVPTGCRFHPRCPMAVGICGWEAEEVREELSRLLVEDKDTHPEGQVIQDIVADGPFALQIMTPDSGLAEKYLRDRIEALAKTRPALAAIRTMQGVNGGLAVTIHPAEEPPLRMVRENVAVACHLVEPELVAQVGAVAAK